MGITYGQIETKGNEVKDAAVAAKGKEEGYKKGAARMHGSGMFPGSPAQWQALEDGYAWIPQRFTYYAKVEPSGFDDAITTMGEAANALYHKGKDKDPTEASRTEAGNYLDDWTGDAASAFRITFWNRLGGILKEQAAFAAILQQALVANKDIHIESRKDLINIGDKAKDALEAAASSGSDWGGADEFKAVLTVVGAVATIAAGAAAIPLTGGGSIAPAGAAAWTMIAGVSALGAFGSDELDKQHKDREDKKSELTAETVDEVIQKMVTTLNDLGTEIANQEDKIIKGLNDNLDELNNTKEVEQKDGYSFSARDQIVIPKVGLVEGSKNPDIRNDFVAP